MSGIEKNDGALVKTIGDAVMAVFASEDAGVTAAVAMLEAFNAFRRDTAHGSRTHLKLGLFSGPCFAITANGVLDYFGQSVNTAARLQGQAGSGEIVMPETTADAMTARGLLGAFTVRERATVALKGVEGTMAIARVSGE